MRDCNQTADWGNMTRFYAVSAMAMLTLLSACDKAASEPKPSLIPTLALATIADDDVAPVAADASRDMALAGAFTQGGWIRGQLPDGAVTAELGETELTLDDSGNFFAAFDRDADKRVLLRVKLADGSTLKQAIEISRRAWNIEHVNVAKRSGRTSEAWWKKREPEWLAIKGAREKVTGASGWQQDFIWPVKGRISGRFGSQRIYRGEPGGYHSGLDIAPGAGTPFVAPADGVVVLAADNFSLEGNLLIIDHGQGLNSAFLHASRLMVSEGDEVKQGQHIGNVGSSGRATGPHLHWSLKWRHARLDPLLFVDPEA